MSTTVCSERWRSRWGSSSAELGSGFACNKCRHLLVFSVLVCSTQEHGPWCRKRLLALRGENQHERKRSWQRGLIPGAVKRHGHSQLDGKIVRPWPASSTCRLLRDLLKIDTDRNINTNFRGGTSWDSTMSQTAATEVQASRGQKSPLDNSASG